MIAYTVSCAFTDASVAARWIAWLEQEHLDDVLDAGAASAEVVRMERAPDEAAACRCEVRYRFASREAFDAYEREHAPGLREEGLRRFPLALGLTYARSVGDVVAQRP